ncbi:MAG TPA: hypothetical protein DDW52_09960 [Planctomycetaceae bacterium]|nr:hypothetical protein [Planctomycetaceae bacterium]
MARTNNLHKRAGTVYIAVLGTSLIVAMLSLAVMHGVRINLRRASSVPDRERAQLLAEAAIEHAVATLQNESSWRSTYLSGVSYPTGSIAMNGGSFSWKLIDGDGNLNDDTSDCVALEGTGIYGRATHTAQVTLQPTDAGLSALEAAFHCAGNIDLGLTVDMQVETFVSSNANIAANGFGESVVGSAEAAGAINGNITGSETPGIAPRQMPGATVFDYYKHVGTYIDLALLAQGNRYQLDDAVLSPNNNPWGPTNPEGVYVIDCQGEEIHVEELRVLGTLCLLNPGPDSRLEKSLFFEPAISNFPSLLVEGSIEVRFDSDKELDEKSVNFNPIGSPYAGVEDNDTSDEYPCEIRGLVYVSGTLDFEADNKDSNFDGVVICGAVAANSDCSFDYDSIFLQYPPPGFGSGSTMAIIPGSYTRVSSQ